MKNYIILAALVLSLNTVYGQYVLKNTSDVSWYNNIPQEDIFIHNNTSLLLSGEYLNYKVYCKNYKTKKLSSNSKIAYVELVGENGVIFKHKIHLENGVGQGDFFLPASLKTGNYKLVAYTRWMTNAVDDHFFQTDIHVINPFTNLNFEEGSNDLSNTETAVNTEGIQLTTDSQTYANRNEVNVVVKSTESLFQQGEYSLSVRKINAMSHDAERVSTTDLRANSERAKVRSTKQVGDVIYLPEFKGEILSGILTNKASGQPVKNKDVVMSLLNEESFQDITKTNDNGVFYFQLPKYYSAPKALVQVLGDDSSRYKIEISKSPSINYTLLNFNDLKLNANDKDAIVKRSINNQIENAYASVKQDKIITPTYPKPFYGNPMRNYNLDDYKRFKTVAETLTEVVDHAWHERRNGKQRFVNVRERETDPYYEVDILPMIIIDGVFYQDHTTILQLDANIVKSIGVLRDEYYYSDKVYQGALVIKTIDGDYYKSMTKDHEKIVDVLQPELKTAYFVQEYLKDKDYSRTPDFRTQLLWQPGFKLTGEEQKLKFFTSDNSGTYEIAIEGFNSEGSPVSIKHTFVVK